jgi:hypothetical protein
MTEAEVLISEALGRCSFLPASWDKRFCRDMAFIAERSREVEISEYQNANLLRLVYKYRRQLPTTIVELALDEMERNADRRSATGRGALPEFSKPKPPRKIKAPKPVQSLPLLDSDRR